VSFFTSFFTVAREGERAEEVKGSKFLAYVAPVSGVEEALEKLGIVRRRYPDATHHPWAYRVGAEVRFSDDGEPGGTAGRPMLEVLQKRGLDRVLGVVTRYYGGTKLGAGGLVRAYGGSLAKVLDEVGTVEVKPTVTRSLFAPFAEMDAVHRLLDAWPGLTKGEARYTERGMVLAVTLLEEDGARLEAELTQVTRGESVLG